MKRLIALVLFANLSAFSQTQFFSKIEFDFSENIRLGESNLRGVLKELDANKFTLRKNKYRRTYLSSCQTNKVLSSPENSIEFHFTRNFAGVYKLRGIKILNNSTHCNSTKLRIGSTYRDIYSEYPETKITFNTNPDSNPFTQARVDLLNYSVIFFSDGHLDKDNIRVESILVFQNRIPYSAR